jgi:serine/threonine-protein kinase
MPPTSPIAHGRFVPGTLLAGRYRIVALQGRGGMGEVYRADDLKLGETVALKFLPETLERDADLRQHMLDETRIARRVSHPNVCRVYDVGEVDGRLFLTMEFVDGEDLASLLRRIGRLPGDKAVQVARELCAGLQSVHDAGILHRDLKPSNVMIDGRGRARLTDFGVAALAERVADRAGTPAYMAPEQIVGTTATVASDIYALGLVLFELFTGKSVYSLKGDGARRLSTPVTPSSVTPDVDRLAERAILRCLEADPARRPSTPLRVAAALPGGDPLAAALAAGETPSPDVVAAVADHAGVRPATAWGMMVAFVVLLGALFALAPQVYLIQRAHIEKPPAVLTDRALEIRKALGYVSPIGGMQPRFSTSQIGRLRVNLRKYGSRHGLEQTVAEGSTLYSLALRTSPRPLIPKNELNLTPSADDPPHTVPGMCDVWVDGAGRLTRLLGVPASFDTLGPRDAAAAYAQAFALAGLDSTRFSRVAPRLQPRVFADSRAAWLGPGRDRAMPVRVEAAVANGRLVSLIIEPPDATHTAGDARTSFSPSEVSQYFFAALLLALFFGCLLLSRRQFTAGRTDLRTAVRLGVVVSLLGTVAALITSVPALSGAFVSSAASNLVTGISGSMLLSVALYLTIEPVLRRTWPESLVSWIRLFEGRPQDPRVGRDVLLGLIAGVGTAVLAVAAQWAASGTSLPQPIDSRWDDGAGQADVLTLGGWPLSQMTGLAMVAIQYGIGTTAALSLVTRMTGRRSLGIVAALFISLFLMGGVPDSPFAVFQALLPTAVIVTVFLRGGLLSMVIAFYAMIVTKSFPFELPGKSWYWDATALPAAAFVTLALWSFASMLGGRPFLTLPPEDKAPARTVPISQRETVG